MIRSLVATLALALAIGQPSLAQGSASKKNPPKEADIEVPVLELAKGDLTITEVVQYYEVSGSTPAEVRADINRKRKQVHEEGAFDAYTHWRVNWRTTNTESPGRCAVKTANITVTLTIVMPKLAAGVPERVKERFDKYWDALLIHETMHADNGRDVGRDIAAGMIRLPAEKDCTAMNAAVQKFGQSLIKRGNQNDLEIDASTDHGMNQGATFP